MGYQLEYIDIVKEIIQDQIASPLNIPSIGGQGEIAYLQLHQDSFVRTIRDIDTLFGQGPAKILELGSFLGPVSIGLKKLGHDVHAQDIPEFHESPRLQAYYRSAGIPFAGINLAQGHLPYESESFEAVLLCEVIEHLNFSPLPVLAEVRRVLKPGGIIYISMPNQAHVLNRTRLLAGFSIYEPISTYIACQDPRDVIGWHWREYTMSETLALIGHSGFLPVRYYYFAEDININWTRYIIKKILYLIPSFRPTQVVIGGKL